MNEKLNPFLQQPNGTTLKDPSFVLFKDAKVLVTGHTGFKGSWLVAILNRLGAQVTGYALEPNSSPSLYNVIHEINCAIPLLEISGMLKKYIRPS